MTAKVVTAPVTPHGLHSGSAMTNRRPPGARATTARRRTTQPPVLRFPCGHLEDQPAVTARTRETPRAAWVACRRCNLIVLVTAQVPGARRSSAAPLVALRAPGDDDRPRKGRENRPSGVHESRRPTLGLRELSGRMARGNQLDRQWRLLT